jgi:hypothetical protein
MVGLSSVALSAAAVLTGINYQLGQGACFSIGNRDADPEVNYSSLPQACRIANGLGVCVMLATISMFVAVGLRNYSPAIIASTNKIDVKSVKGTVLDKLEEGRQVNVSISSKSNAPVLADLAKVCRADDFEVGKVYSRSDDFEARVDRYQVMM